MNTPTNALPMSTPPPYVMIYTETAPKEIERKGHETRKPKHSKQPEPKPRSPA